MLRNPSKIDPKMVEISWQIELWSRPGALWAPSWRQDGPRATPTAKVNQKYSILGWPVGFKMDPKSRKSGFEIVTKNKLIFNHIFNRFWLHFGPHGPP